MDLVFLNIKKILMFTCSSNNQNFIITFSNQAVKYLIKRLDYNLSSPRIDFNKYNYSISNYKLSSDMIKTLHLNNHQEISFSEIIRSNFKDIISFPINDIIEPIYIYDKKEFDNIREAQKWWISKSLKSLNEDNSKRKIGNNCTIKKAFTIDWSHLSLWESLGKLVNKTTSNTNPMRRINKFIRLKFLFFLL